MMAGSINRTLIRVIGMARSGNHAIVNWCLAQLPGRWCFLNCVEPKTNPFHSARPLEAGADPFRTNIAGFSLEAEQQGHHCAKDHLLVSMEDVFLGPALGKAGAEMHRRSVGGAQREITVLILRDPYNLFASRRRFGHQFVTDGTALRIWKQHARTFLDQRKYPAGTTVGISYNRWATEGDYRRGVAAALGLRFTDAGREHVPACAGGSSFDGGRYDGRASEMKVLERWRHYAEDETFWSLFDAETADFAGRIFGLAQPQTKFGRAAAAAA